MTTSPFSRAIPLAFPKVNRTKPWRTSSRLASRTSRRRSGSSIASAGRLLRPQLVFRNTHVEEANCVGGRAYAARDGGGRGYRGLSRLPMFHDGRDLPPRKTGFSGFHDGRDLPPRKTGNSAPDNIMPRPYLPTANACRSAFLGPETPSKWNGSSEVPRAKSHRLPGK